MKQVDVLLDWVREHDIDASGVTRVFSALDAGGMALPGLEVQPFYDPAGFAWTAWVASQSAPLKAELAALADRCEVHPESDRLLRRGRWRALFLWRRGRQRSVESDVAPVGVATAAAVPGGGSAGNAYFSILDPGTEIVPHIGHFNARLRCHVGLSIPPGAWIEVAGVRREWQAGGCLVFSDALTHHVANDGLEARAVFTFDFWHPGVTLVERAALSMLLQSQL